MKFVNLHNKILPAVRSFYEQPRMEFQFNYLIYASDEMNYDSITTCSSFSYFNKLAENFQKCPIIKHWTYDTNYDGKIDFSYIELLFNNTLKFTNKLKFYLVFFYNARLELKCLLEPPAILIHELEIPEKNFDYNDIEIVGRLDLIQNIQFYCPFYEARDKTNFENNIIRDNAKQAQAYNINRIKKLIMQNPAYFEFKSIKSYREASFLNMKLKIKITMSINEVVTKYYLSLLEALGLLCIYLASFFAVSFYIYNKIKDFLFSRRYLNSWEVVPWEKFK
ncbi:uncharacterized protein LOC129616358 isoform X2 [Condylostylus longicornis]|uniref:uncharacterized protein LOC129616358 isoform X2 n=1 Tax=Condylostylus longicornis TaxID=2530218 RepID=UPI00244E4B65|nr:uncharacterized protein LOC129616358 isoform X2 [Condylostylus longicornis]